MNSPRLQPLISVAMPVHNCGKTLRMSIRSVLWQTYPNWELLILDDGSTDETLEIARSFDDSRIRVLVDGSRHGLPARLNEAISQSKGEYLARMDGDDVAYPERLERQIRFLEKHAELDLLGAGILIFRADGQPMGTRTIFQTHAEICRRPWAGFYLPHPTWMAKTAWFRKQRYRTRAVRLEDQDLMLRTYQYSNFASLPEILLAYREESFSVRKALTTRYQFVRLLAREPFICGNNRLLAWLGMVEHTLKATVEVVAVATGLTYRILRHRARPVDQPTLNRWQQLWSELEAPKALALPSPETHRVDDQTSPQIPVNS
jgi:glycosyltransferase involved in cell wall biosynthesis